MEGNPYESTDAKHTHRIEMLMLAILVLSSPCSTCRLGPALSNPTTTSSSSSSPTSTSSAARITSPSRLYFPPHPDLLHRDPAASYGPHLLSLRHLQLDDS